MIKNRALLVVVLTITLLGCSGCLASCFPDSKGGFVDYLTGNSLKRDKVLSAEETKRVQIRLEEQIEKRKEAEADLATQQLKTEEAQANADAAEFRAEEAKYRIAEKKVEGTNEVLEAVALDIKVSSITRSMLQAGAPVLAIIAVLGLGLAACWLLIDYRSPLVRRRRCGREEW